MVGHRWGRTLAPGTWPSSRRRRWSPRRSRRGTVRGRRRRAPGDGAVRVTDARIAAPRDPSGSPGTWFRRTRDSTAAARWPASDWSSAGAAAASRRRWTCRPEAFAAGPFGDVVLVGDDDGTLAGSRRSMRRRLPCAARHDRDVIRRATVSPDGSTVYEARVARRTAPISGSGRDRSTGRRPRGPSSRHRPPTAGSGAHGPPSSLVGRGRPARGPVVWRDGLPDAAVRPGRRHHRAGRRPGARATGRRGRGRRDRLRRVPRVPVPARRDGCCDRRAAASWPRRPARPSWCRTGCDTRGGPRDRRARRPSPAAVGPDGVGRHRPRRRPRRTRAGPLGSAAGSGLRLPPGWVLLAPDGRLPLDRRGSPTDLRHVPDGRSVPLDEVSR